jgi:uncharacterized protein YdaU (DUF1376 family)
MICTEIFMAALPYMPLYVADYLADTSHLTTAEHGAYLLLIMNYWQRGGSLPGDDVRLARIARVSLKVWAEMKPTMAEFFKDSNGQWIHYRIEKELELVRVKSEKARQAGLASAERRQSARSTVVQRTFNGRSTKNEQTSNHTDTDTDTDNNTLVQKRAAKPPKGGGESDFDFEEFWQLYPRREARKEAEKAYDKARRLASKEELHGKTAAYAKSRAGQDPQFTPLAASWLNKERWRDVNANPTQAASSPRHYGPHVPPAPADRIDEAAILASRIHPLDPNEWPTEEETREEFERFMALWPKRERASGSKDHDMWRAVRSRWAADDLFAELELYRATLTPLTIRTAPWMWRWLEKYFLVLPNERLTRKTKQNSNGNVMQPEGRMS